MFLRTLFMDFTKLDGLIPAVAQDTRTSEVLMVGFMNADALDATRRTGYATFFSRSRGKLWRKTVTRLRVSCCFRRVKFRMVLQRL